MTTPAVFCTHCGAERPPAANFCAQCGRALTDPEPVISAAPLVDSPIPEPPPPWSSPPTGPGLVWGVIIGVSALAVLAILFAMFGLTDRDHREAAARRAASNSSAPPSTVCPEHVVKQYDDLQRSTQQLREVSRLPVSRITSIACASGAIDTVDMTTRDGRSLQWKASCGEGAFSLMMIDGKNACP